MKRYLTTRMDELGFWLIVSLASAAVASVALASDLQIEGAMAAPRVHYRADEVDGVDVFYREAGHNNLPVLLLLQGSPTSSVLDLRPD